MCVTPLAVIGGATGQPDAGQMILQPSQYQADKIVLAVCQEHALQMLIGLANRIRLARFYVRPDSFEHHRERLDRVCRYVVYRLYCDLYLECLAYLVDIVDVFSVERSHLQEFRVHLIDQAIFNQSLQRRPDQRSADVQTCCKVAFGDKFTRS